MREQIIKCADFPDKQKRPLLIKLDRISATLNWNFTLKQTGIIFSGQDKKYGENHGLIKMSLLHLFVKKYLTYSN